MGWQRYTVEAMVRMPRKAEVEPASAKQPVINLQTY